MIEGNLKILTKFQHESKRRRAGLTPTNYQPREGKVDISPNGRFVMRLKWLTLNSTKDP